MKKIFLYFVFFVIISIFVYAGDTGIDTTAVTSQGKPIYVDLLLITSSYDVSINVTYPDGTDVVFVPKVSIVGKRIYKFTNTLQSGEYRFHSYDTSLGQWQSSTYVELSSSSEILNSLSVIPTGVTFGILNKTVEHDWLIVTGYSAVSVSGAICDIYRVNDDAYITSSITSVSGKNLNSRFNLSSNLFSRGESYYSLCNFVMTVNSISANVTGVTQFLYITQEDLLKQNIDDVISRQNYNINLTLRSVNQSIEIYKFVSMVNKTVGKINTTVNLIKLNTTEILNITKSNRNWVQNIWYGLMTTLGIVNRTELKIDSINKTIVENNTFIIEQLKKDKMTTFG